MNNSEKDTLSDLNSQTTQPSASSCPEFLHIESSVTENDDFPCNSCGNHECSRRLVSSESVEAAEQLGGMNMVFGAFFVFIFPLITGIVASMFSNSSYFGTPQTWKSAVGFIVGLILGVLIARLTMFCMKTR